MRAIPTDSSSLFERLEGMSEPAGLSPRTPPDGGWARRRLGLKRSKHSDRSAQELPPALALDTALDFTPVVGTVKNMAEVGRGRDFISDKPRPVSSRYSTGG